MVLVTAIVPPWAVTIALTIAWPRHAPRRSTESQKRSKIRSRSSFHFRRLAAGVVSTGTTRSLDSRTVGQYPVQVKSITYSAARENLASTINRVCEDQAPIVITRNRDQAVVMLSLAEYESLQETAYLLRSPANAKRLIAAVETLNRGKGIKRKLRA